MIKALYSTLVEIADSKKAVMAILSVAAMLGAKYGLGFDPTQAFELISPLLVAIAGQAHVDAKMASSKAANDNAPDAPKVAQAGFARPGIMLAIALAGILLACTHQQRVIMSGDFKACAKADLGALMPTGLTLAEDVAAKIRGNAPTLMADLDAAAVLVGVDAVKCAAVAAIAVLTAPSGSGAASAEPLPGIAVAKEWIGTR